MSINNDGIITIASDIAVSDSGTYTVTATGDNNYEGSVSDDFVLTVEANITGTLSYQDIMITYGTQADSAPTWADVEDSNQTLSYDFKSGTTIPTGISIDTANGTVSVSNMASAMTAQAFTVVAAGTGSYEGTIEGDISITINRKDLSTAGGSMTFDDKTITSGTDQMHTGTVDFPDLTAGTDYILSISPSVSGMTIENNGKITILAGSVASSGGTYTVTASGNGNYNGTVENTFVFTVKKGVNSLSYSPASQDITVSTAMQDLTPTVEPSGATGTYTVSPALPNGITMEGGTGIISGTPSSTSKRKPYTITIKGNGDFAGEATFEIYLGVIVASYNVGDPGPAGGTIIYKKTNAGTDGWTYLEAASQNLGKHPWDAHIYTGGTGTEVGTEKGIGKGKTNTESIIAHQTKFSMDITTYAAGQCSEYESEYYDDWFLPSEDELAELFNHVTKVEKEQYWSSTETSASTSSDKPGDLNAIVYLNRHFSPTMTFSAKSIESLVHPVRAF